ncbi:lipoprotein nlpI [Klebsiella pneumoniae]|nr:lipoprotein nlpI [Klebsiella pneumoniae]
MKPFLRWCFVATALTLAGCSSTAWRKDAVLAVPLQPTLQQEVILARMEQILASRALSDDERAQLCKFTQILQLPQNTKGGIARC